MNDLKPEWRVFAEQYVIDWNGTRSYQVAYPNADYDTARSNQSKLLAKTCITDYIEEIQKDLSKLAGVSALGNILELKKILQGEDSKDERTIDKIKAIEVINKMVGYNAPDKTDITSGGDKIGTDYTDKQRARLEELEEMAIKEAMEELKKDEKK